MELEVLEDKKSKSILKYILIPVCVLLILEVAVFSGVIAVGGVIQRLEQNARDILQERLINRKSFLENEMVTNWSNLELLANQINVNLKNLQDDNQIEISKLDQGSDYVVPLLNAISDDMISELRSSHVSGIFVVFNNHDLDNGVYNKPGLYIRDLDPTSKPSANNTDLLIERGPSAIVKQLNISTDVSWHPQFAFSKAKDGYYPFLYYPYQEAINNQKEYSVSDLGYWSPTYRLNGDVRDVISYSIPLIDDMGYVYGVLGVEITHEYLNTLLPETEINESGTGSYCLAIGNKGKTHYDCIYNNGTVALKEEPIQIQDKNGDVYLNELAKKENTYVALESLKLYNSNTPYADDNWTLLAMIPNNDLLSFSNNIIYILFLALLLTVCFGVIGSFFISFRISHPITSLLKQMMEEKNSKQFQLKKTNISEIDHLVDSIEELNKNKLDTAYRFSKIIELASVKLAAFEVNLNKKEFFITENYFEVFQQENVDQKNMTIAEFKEKMLDLAKYIKKTDVDKYLFHIPKDNDLVFIELTISSFDDTHKIGLAEDITQRILEQNIIEYERDHDALTGLLNRRAFWREMNELFQNKEKLKVAAFLMIDLDNLKYINDNYGHDSGDTYILRATEAFVKYSPKNTLISRISGDEFHLFFYGYDKEEDIRVLIEQLKAGIDSSYMVIANQKQFYIKVSGGISWYPKDSDSVQKLQLYSDYAMYKVKHSEKGEFKDFSLENYESDFFLSRNKEELEIMIRDEQVQYYFQPIISADDGSVYAYEALMRSFMPTLKNPEEILNLAKQENKLEQIEVLTFFKSLQGYKENVDAGNISMHSKIFINSIASHMMPDNKIEELEKMYQPYLKNIVVEVTEGEKINEPLHRKKEERVRIWGGQLALDDYGSGYNSEMMLLNITPKYIKIDMDIIRGIDKDSDKQKLVENIVSYAHERDMIVVAEGIETIEELKQVINLDVDLLQGYLLAKPQKTPVNLSKDMIMLIQSLHANK